jgi:hypothetical protein
MVVSSPFRGFESQAFKARAFLGLLVLALVPGQLGTDFYALMYIAGISLRGRDEHRWKRRRLRRFVENLVEKGVVGAEKAVYSDVKIRLRGEPIGTQDHVPAKGIICWVGMKYARRPRGRRPKTYWLKLPKLDTPHAEALDLALSESDQPHPSVISRVSSEVQTVHNFLRDLLRENQVGEVEGPADLISAELEQSFADRVAYVLGCFETSRGIAKRLCAIMPLLPRIEERTHSLRSKKA